MSQNAEIDKAVAELVEAGDELHAAQIKTEIARRDETACVNRVNEAQKRLDALMLELKNNAPRGSAWHNSKLPKYPTP